ncbi:MAG: glutamate racemase [Flavicella sp.]
MSKHPIGIFDSGVGGLSIWKEITELLPNENTIYLADSKHAPYGKKSRNEIIRLCKKNTELLLNKGCKLIVVACNTATTNAIDILRETYPVSFIGIEPAIKPASIQTKTNTIGVLATKGTLNSNLFAKTSNLHNKGIQIIEQDGEGLVPLIEKGAIYSNEMQVLLSKYIEPMIAKNVDCLVLGCSHYPFLIPQIEKVTKGEIQIIDSGKAVAKQTKTILEKEELVHSNKTTEIKHQIYTNESTEIVKHFVNEIERDVSIDYLEF